MENFTEILYNGKKPKTADEYYVSGLNCIIERDAPSAIDCFIKCVKLDTNVIDAYYRLSRLYESTGEHKKAIRILTDLLLRPSLPKILMKKIEDALIDIYSSSSNSADALSLVLKKSQNNPKDPRYKIILSGIYEEQENWDDALVAYKAYAKLSKVVDSKREARIKVGLCRDNYIDHPPSVIKQAKSILKVEPICPNGYTLLIEMYKRENSPKALVEAWKQYMWFCPIESAAQFKTMESDLFDCDVYASVQTVLEHASKNNSPDAYGVQMKLIEFYSKKGDLDAVDTMFDKLLNASETTFEHLKELLVILEKLENVDHYVAAINKKF